MSGLISGGTPPGPGDAWRFDLLLMVDVLQFAPRPLDIMRSALAALKPGGGVYTWKSPTSR